MARKMLILMMALAVMASVAMPAMAQTATRQGMPGKADQMISALQSRPELSQFTNALKQSDLYNTINNGGLYTVFAPTNDAFSRMPAQKASIMNQNQQGMDYVLGYHIVSGKLWKRHLQSTNSLTTLNTRTVAVSMAGNDIMIDGARIIGEGMNTENVMIYPINTVMVPPMLT